MVNVQADEELVRIKIKDFGIGIEAKDLPFIFDRLFRTDPARSRGAGGTGLGLSLVKWIVEAHQGEVRVHSQPDEWTEIYLSFPIGPSSETYPASPNGD
jgi:signal transduction histidine kinase